MQLRRIAATAASFPILLAIGCGADNPQRAASEAPSPSVVDEASEALEPGEPVSPQPESPQPESPQPTPGTAPGEVEPEATHGTFVFSAQTTSGSPVVGVAVNVVPSNHCEATGPAQFQLPTSGIPVTETDGTAVLAELPPGCYGFGLIETPISSSPVPTSYLGTALTAGSRVTIDLLFNDPQAELVDGVFRLVNSDTGAPVVGKQLTLASCTGGSALRFTDATDSQGVVRVASAADCLQVEGLRGRTSPCSVDEQGQEVVLRSDFDHAFHVTNTRSDLGGTC
ncbi:hypothetical protein IEU95_07215 [Hoyosella rhizosphaerae]|uniref:Prealbumin-like fold domain-containing protein n=1 Tax=Hoyosella rhizosphaerae TaxID=1755582 RepID=A0A916X9S2_9ACTN|nr:hypothetical protein [Hoyosella rhizosphaerae]MBN4926612.1 hypothetical protein [Hoyosella rhizosphaerae]GGC57920.1 hypothetical protein GCM10011410_07960 [Hoyosella rhizosphaerae]